MHQAITGCILRIHIPKENINWTFHSHNSKGVELYTKHSIHFNYNRGFQVVILREEGTHNLWVSHRSTFPYCRLNTSEGIKAQLLYTQCQHTGVTISRQLLNMD